eukprot:PhM_4_TR2321/c0_g1_i1/m.70075
MDFSPLMTVAVVRKSDYVTHLANAGPLLVAGTTNRQQCIVTFDAATLRAVHRFPNASSDASSLVSLVADPSSNGESPILYSCFSNGLVAIYDVRQNVPVGKVNVCTEGDTQGFAVTCDGSHMILGDGIFTVVADLRARSIATKLENHSDTVTCVSAHPTRASVFCTGSEDGLISVTDLAEGELENVISVNSAINSVLVAPNGIAYAATSLEGLVTCNIDTGDVLGNVPRRCDASYIASIAPIGGSPRVFLGRHGEAYEDVVGNTEMYTLFEDGRVPSDLIASFSGGHTDLVRCALEVGQGVMPYVRIVTGSEDGNIVLWQPKPATSPDDETEGVSDTVPKKSYIASSSKPYTKSRRRPY